MQTFSIHRLVDIYISRATTLYELLPVGAYFFTIFAYKQFYIYWCSRLEKVENVKELELSTGNPG